MTWETFGWILLGVGLGLLLLGMGAAWERARGRHDLGDWTWSAPDNVTIIGSGWSQSLADDHHITVYERLPLHDWQERGEL